MGYGFRSARVALVTVVVVMVVVSVTACGGSTTVTSEQMSTSTVVSTAASQSPPTAGQTIYTDLAYANGSAAQKLDIYLPTSGEGPFPVVVYIHGGAFMFGDKADGDLSAIKAGLDRGYAVVSLNYRFAAEAKFPAQVNDVKAAIRWMRANASQYKLDPDMIVAWGASAGANLACMLGTSGGVADLEDSNMGNADQSSAVQAVVDWFGPISFADLDRQFTASGLGAANHGAADSPESQYLGSALAEVPELVAKANPTTYISADDPPFLIEHGTKDSRVATEQSIDFAAALTKVLGADKVTLKLLEGADHEDPMFTTVENIAFVFDWIDSQFK
jgi:acetyl esterase/lipase